MTSGTPLIQALSWAAELAVPVIVWRRHSKDPARWKVALLCLLWLAVDLVVRYADNEGRGTHWITFLFDPVQTMIMLWLLSEWQTSIPARLAIRLLMPAYFLSVTTLTLLSHSSATFGLLTHSVTSLTLLTTLLFTLVTRRLAEPEQPLRDADWFWICSGLVLFCLLEGVGGPMLRHFAAEPGQRRFPAALTAQLTGMTVVALILARGVLCPEPGAPKTFAPDVLTPAQ